MSSQRRMIDSSMWTSDNFTELPFGARLLQLGIINHADDQGRVRAIPKYLRVTIFPYDQTTDADIQDWLQLLAAQNTIILYEAEGKQYAQLVNWWKYQSLQYAQPSPYPRPAGWQDRVRRTITKGMIATCNWLKVNGEPIEDTCDQDGKPLPPKRRSNSNGGHSPERTNGDTNDLPEIAEETVSFSGDDSPESSPEGAMRIEEEYNLMRKEGEDHACATVSATETTAPPILGNSPTGDPYMDIAWNRHNGNGNGKQYLSRQKAALDGLQSKLKKHGISSEQFTKLVNAYLDQKGTRVLADGEGELADRELSTAQNFVVELCGIGRRFHSEDGIKLLWQSWRDNDKRTNPSEYQLIQHAGQMVAGTFEKAAQPAAKKLTFKDWCIRNYNTDSLNIIGIPEQVLRSQYEQANRVH